VSRRRWATSTALAAATITLAVCATATAARSSTSPAVLRAPSKAAFIRRADMVCRQVEAKVNPVKARLNAHSSLSQLARILDAVASVEQAGLKRLRALPEPAGSRPVLSEVWDAFDVLTVDLQHAAQASRDDNPGEVSSDLDSAQAAQARYRGLAHGYGFRYCGASHPAAS
jgi:hypothetical protein